MDSAGATVPAPFGRVVLRVERGRISRVVLSPEPAQPEADRALPLLKDLRRQIERYFKDASHRFQFEGEPVGTDFQQRVWLALKEIAPGEVRTYGELARSLGSGPRAVAGACRANPWPLLVPCHRIVGSHGEGGYLGHAEGPCLAIKRWLLTHEARR